MAANDIEILRFTRTIEQAIAVANREIIHPLIPDITSESVMPLAISVARLRARYLQAAFRIASDDHGDTPNEAEIEELRHHREMYQEARQAFEALMHAIERGYVGLAE